ncbi:MAG: hypothetical protein IKU34_09800 [Clostridia bacterium]|nr:hypothetical protein [Clostridia bacterium]
MIKAYRSMWKNVFRLNEPASIKEFWLGQIAHVIALYLLLIPFAGVAFAAKAVGIGPEILLPVSVVLMMLFWLIPAFSLTLRRARDFRMTVKCAVLLMICLPAVGALLIGIVKPDQRWSALPKMQRVGLQLLAVGLGLGMWGGTVLMVLGTPAAMMAGMMLMGVGMFMGYIAVKREEARLKRLSEQDEGK